MLALALCHNVRAFLTRWEEGGDVLMGVGWVQVTPVVNDDGSTTYQASSPDEVAIVQWTESVGASSPPLPSLSPPSPPSSPFSTPLLPFQFCISSF